jgi:hypothetical protein
MDEQSELDGLTSVKISENHKDFVAHNSSATRKYRR